MDTRGNVLLSMNKTAYELHSLLAPLAVAGLFRVMRVNHGC
jgi:hypothetical protein